MGSNSPPIRWGLIGCGDVVRKRVAAAIQSEPRSELVAACRRDEERLEQFCEQFQVPRRYSTDTDLIADEEIDAVYIATPVREHVAQAVASARTGKHVLVEKPMAMSVEECDEIIQACRENNVKLGVAYYRRFYPLVRRIEELMKNGELGTPLAVSAVTSTAMGMAAGEEGYWRVLADDGGGGALMDIGSHRINLFAHLFGPVTHIQGICRTIDADYSAEDSAVALFGFAKGPVGTLQCHFGSPIDPDEFAITGTKGRLWASPLNGSELHVKTGDGERTERHDPPTNLCGPLIADFVSAILDDREPLVTGDEGRETNAIMARVYAAAQQQKSEVVED
jgi:predicted dehydrogenase